MRGVFPGALWRPVRFHSDTGSMRNPLGWILHVAQMNGSPWQVFDSSPKGRRKTSTGWVGKDGDIEQYILISAKPWAQGEGNSCYAAWETEGWANEPLTAAQINALAAIHIWQGTADKLALTPGEQGIGTHEMGGSSWGGHACPGPVRSGQRRTILAVVEAMKAGGNVPLSDSDIRRIAEAVQLRYQVHSPEGGLVTRDAALGEMWELLADMSRRLDALRVTE